MSDANELVSVPKWHLHTMAAAINGATPDKNTQSPQEYESSVQTIRALATIYDAYSIGYIKEKAAAFLGADLCRPSKPEHQ